MIKEDRTSEILRQSLGKEKRKVEGEDRGSDNLLRSKQTIQPYLLALSGPAHVNEPVRPGCTVRAPPHSQRSTEAGFFCISIGFSENRLRILSVEKVQYNCVENKYALTPPYTDGKTVVVHVELVNYDRTKRFRRG